MRQLGEQTWVLEGPTNIGFIVRNRDVLLIDSGNDKEAGRRINKVLKEKDWTLKGLINTHSNADHIGGNDYFQRNLNCPVYAPVLEYCFIEHPELEAAFLWGGYAVKDLRSKFFQARPSRVTGFLSPGDDRGLGLEILSLKGHFFNMIGIRTPDDVLFLGDCLFGSAILEKYGIPFIYDVAAYKQTIQDVRELEARYYVPSHGPAEEEIDPLAQNNLAMVSAIESQVKNILSGPGKTFDRILKDICDLRGIVLNAGQYALVGSTIRSFLTYLNDRGEVRFDFTENRMLWSLSN